MSSAQVTVSGMATKSKKFRAELRSLLLLTSFFLPLAFQGPGMQKGKDIPRICSLFLVLWGLFFLFFFLVLCKERQYQIKKKKLKNKKENNKIVKLTIVFCLTIPTKRKMQNRTGYKVYELSVFSLNDFFSSAFQRFPFFFCSCQLVCLEKSPDNRRCQK